MSTNKPTTETNLRELTLAAIEEGKREAAGEKKLEQESAALQQQKEATLRAQEIIDNIPHLAKEAAKAGKPCAVVMGLDQSTEYEEHAGFTNCGKLNPEWLIGAAQLVYAACADAGLRPAVHDGLDESFEYGMFFIAIPCDQSEA